jgi:hypothetical protein
MNGFPFGGNGESAHAERMAGAAPGGETEGRYLGR